jgi:hypothetical protein
MKKKHRAIRAAAIVGLLGIPMVLAAVPKTRNVSSDTALYQTLSEINVKKVGAIDFDQDIQRLSAQEKEHRKAIPLSISSPMERVMKVNYKPSHSKKKKFR